MRTLSSRLALAGLWLGSMVPAPAQEATAFTGQLSLVRYDMPRGRSDGFAPTRQVARRKDGPDAVDWPDFTLNGQPIWRDAGEAVVPLKLRKGAEASSPFQMLGDDVIEPGGHWFRAMEWRTGRSHIYTADRSARTANAGEAPNGRYELWAFPIVVQGEGGPVVKSVEVKASGQIVFRRGGPWRSLTLLLPANPRGAPYELSVEGRGPVQFEVGLMPVKLGDPRERALTVRTTFPGDGPKITMWNLERPEEFPNPKEWQADLQALGKPLPAAPVVERFTGLQRHLGMAVPRSPFTTYAIALPHGLSGGFYRKGMSADVYAAFVAGSGYDAVFDQANSLPPPESPESFELRAAALARRGVRLGLQYDNNWTRPSLQHPNLTFFSHALPDWHAPLYRSLSLTAQRFARLPNFAGIDIGSDNAGYVSFWHWAPPIPDRPWGEAMIEFAGTPQPRMARAPSLGPRQFSYERPVSTQAEFIKYVERYENAFRQYGYFAEAVREVDSRLVFTTGSFGSAPGTGARGGWPWSSLPGRVIAEGLTTQQAYDWNETHAAKPLHSVALIDRLRSYHPKKRTWALLDNFQFLYGREAWQRACALALTRGIQGLGTNFLANPEGDTARPDVVAFQSEMNAWMRKYGGVYARTEPLPVIGVFYGHHQAVQRRILTGANPTAEQLLTGSHEGKVAEALFLCHAAGWPARVVTFQELMRGPLPSPMKALLLVGLDRPDESWAWSNGLEPALQQFVERGGRIIADTESSCPLDATRPGLEIAAYIQQSHFDATPQLFARNAENIARLREAMADLPAPIATSDDPLLWAIPTECGDTQFVTAVNQGFAEGAEAQEMLRPADPKATKPEIWKTKGNASLYVQPRRAHLKWNSNRPIYDVRLGRKVTAAEAAEVDFTHDAFQWYALPPQEVVAPEVTITGGVSGFFEAKPQMTSGGISMSGLPIEITVSETGGSVSVFTTTGQVVRLPVQRSDAGEFSVTVRELLTGLATTTHFHSEPPPVSPTPAAMVKVRDRAALAKFSTRKHVALTIALTPEQRKDATVVAQANALREHYQRAGRVVGEIGTVSPGGIVTSLQTLKTPHRFPQWQTTASDLVLFGSAANNVLLLDQVRGQLFPLNLSPPSAGQAELLYTRSPFVGEYDVINVLASDAAGIAAGVNALKTSFASKAD